MALNAASQARAQSTAPKNVPISRFDDNKTVNDVYARIEKNLHVIRKKVDNRPLSLAEKILYGHLADPNNQELIRGKSFLHLRPDRVAMQGKCIITLRIRILILYTNRRFGSSSCIAIYFFGHVARSFACYNSLRSLDRRYKIALYEA